MSMWSRLQPATTAFGRRVLKELQSPPPQQRVIQCVAGPDPRFGMPESETRSEVRDESGNRSPSAFWPPASTDRKPLPRTSLPPRPITGLRGMAARSRPSSTVLLRNNDTGVENGLRQRAGVYVILHILPELNWKPTRRAPPPSRLGP